MTVGKLIDAFGGEIAVAARFEITRQAVRYWIKIDRLPGHMYLPVSELAAERSIELDPGLFYFERKPRRKKHAEATQERG